VSVDAWLPFCSDECRDAFAEAAVVCDVQADHRVVDMTTADGREYITAMLIRTGAGDVTLVQPDGSLWVFVDGVLTINPAPSSPF
jgi:hypothetical protein